MYKLYYRTYNREWNGRLFFCYYFALRLVRALLSTHTYFVKYLVVVVQWVIPQLLGITHFIGALITQLTKRTNSKLHTFELEIGIWNFEIFARVPPLKANPGTKLL